MTAPAPSRLAQLRDADPLTTACWPGHPELPLKIRAISCSEVNECRAAADAELKRQGITIDPSNLDAKEEEIATQVLFRALRDAEDPRKPFAVDVNDLRANMTPDERGALFVLFNDHRATIDPDPETMDPATLAAIVDAVKKKDRTALKRLGSAALASSLLTTAVLLSSSPTGRSASSSG